MIRLAEGRLLKPASAPAAAAGATAARRSLAPAAAAAGAVAAPTAVAAPRPRRCLCGSAHTAVGSSRLARAGARPAAAPRSRARRRAAAPPARAAAADPPPLTADERAALRASVDAAAATLDEIVEEVSREVFVSEAAAYLYEEAADVAMADAVRGAVARRIEWLDANFLAAVGAYGEAARQAGDGPLVELLGLLRDEVLSQVTLRMPAPLRVLDAALQHDRITARLRVLRAALAGGRGDVPGVGMEALAATANQFVDDMEDQEIVADRVLLARLVLVREELRALHARSSERAAARSFFGGAEPPAARRARPPEERRGGVLYGPQEPAGAREAAAAAGAAGPDVAEAAADQAAASSGSSGAGAGAAAGEGEDTAASIAAAAAAAAADDGGFFSFHRGNIPRRCAAFVKELLAVGEPPRRMALLRKAFTQDWDGSGPPRPPGTVPTGSAGADAGGAAQEAPDLVRPGRLLSTVHAFRRELEMQSQSKGGASGGGGGEDNTPGLLKRLGEIQLEATLVLDEMQRGKRMGGGGGGGGGGSSGGGGGGSSGDGGGGEGAASSSSSGGATGGAAPGGSGAAKPQRGPM
ncbi:hypothetical protein Rsub_09764 [Raphidocelis subcapitata]|uniref:Uncharacterized protein n=1 Tax=Raphidocelis subcapitata TaxID=307507 RepID=A0A2V0PCY6_9CHLO|nr:hypothetical protein Rsub_09764 [Raphidocelis subcapitata]|eukprot:GBF97706.1 hypothetical protein Rsub_09764 [Raphidocelis subcapitata]